MSNPLAVLKTPVLSITRAYQRLRSTGERVDVTTEDWDTLVLLDGCRYDIFERLNTLPGDLEERLSRGSATDEFVESNFGDGTYNDIVYVTANPRVNRVFQGNFHAMVNVWEDGWDDDYQTVLPETLADATLQIQKQYPNKRIVSHFIQPHAPFIGEFARENLGSHSTLSDHLSESEGSEPSRENIWTLLRRGDVQKETVIHAYEENLEVTLPHVARILEFEQGKTVVTSDHGNLLGERIPPFMRRFYGHPSRFQARGLLSVPWLEHNGGTRREIVTEESDTNTSNKIDSDVEEKLKHLGYA